MVFLFELFAQINVFRNGLVVRQGPISAEPEVVQLEGLFQVIVGPLLHGFDRRFDRAKSSNDNHHCGRVKRAGLLQNIQPLRARSFQVQVRNDQVRAVAFHPFQGCFATVVREDLMPLLAQQIRHHLQHGDLVIDNHNIGHCPCCSSNPGLGQEPNAGQRVN